MKTKEPHWLAPDLLAELDVLEARLDRAIDLSDIPEILDGSEAARGFYRPVKTTCCIQLDVDVVAWFKVSGAVKPG